MIRLEDASVLRLLFPRSLSDYTSIDCEILSSNIGWGFAGKKYRRISDVAYCS